MNPLPVQTGEIVDGKYRIDELLGVGGMGAVFAAHHLQLDDRVAIKVMRAEGLADPLTVERFSREARAAVKIKGKHVVRVLDVGTLPNGVPFMVMEYLEGSDLSEWLRTRGPLPVQEAVGFLIQAGEALAEAHAQGIVHRDLKPANLFVVQQSDGGPTLKVLDFGISKMNGDSEGFTQTSVMMGSPYHMAPEQMRSAKHADARSDVWAFGSILHELLSGKPPFDADNMAEIVSRVMFEQSVPITALRSDVPIELERFIERCMQKDPALRFQSIGELADALSPFCPDWALTSLTRIAAVTGTTSQRPAARQRVGTVVWLSLFSGAVTLTALAVWWSTRSDEAPIQTASKPAAADPAATQANRIAVTNLLQEPPTAPPNPPASSHASSKTQVAVRVADQAPRLKSTQRPAPAVIESSHPAAQDPTQAKPRDIEALIGERH